MWKRESAINAVTWGQTDIKADEMPRPQFFGDERRSPENDDMEAIHFSTARRKKYFALGMLVSISLACVAISIVSGIIILRWNITNDLIFWGIDLAGPLCSTLNAIQIQAFNFIYTFIAVMLTNKENHKT
jgi:hypothetical protein